MATDSFMIEKFDLEDYFGEVAVAWRQGDPGTAIRRLVDPAAAIETLSWGRNYIYVAKIRTAGGEREVTVKQFRNQGSRARLERWLKGSKAARSWRAARALQEAGVPTPEPVLLIESRKLSEPSFFVTRRLTGVVEARFYFRALESGRESEEFPWIEPARLVESLGRAIRKLHDAGIWHRDVSVGNLLLRRSAERGEPPEIFFVDLNRARIGRRLTIWQRTRDLCRLRIFASRHQDLLLGAYWEGNRRGFGCKRMLYRLCFRGFLLKGRAKEIVRRPLHGLRDRLLPRRPHVHIPPAPEGAAPRDRAVWDGLSDQPHQHATRLQRLAVRVADLRPHGRELLTGLAVMPSVWRRYRELRSELYRKPVSWQGMGVAVRPWPESPGKLLTVLERLGTRRVFLRLHPWQADHAAEQELARELARRGYELTFGLPQNRALVRDRARWRAAITELAEEFGGLGRYFQVGQAINRSKWGIWNHVEYLELFAAAAEILRRDPRIELLGPAVIDYEPYRTAGVVNISWEGVHFDVLASLLYVDRRGAPENRQLGFDTVDKVVQIKAIAETARQCGGRSWITEFNWPLREGPHSPAGRKVAVTEQSQASYLVRYFLLALGTGLVERVFWWQLVARGYGLCHENGRGSLRLRPGFHAFVTLYRQLEGSIFLGPVEGPEPGRQYHFRRQDGAEIVAAWSADDSPLRVTLPRMAIRAVDRDGQEMPVPVGAEVEIDGAPRYFWLAPS